MNKKFLLLILVLLILVVNPSIALQGATNGLTLWFDVIVPTLLPFMIISHLIQNVYGSGISNPLLYISVTGLLCGFPMGAYTTASMYRQKKISEKMAYLLLMCCNVSSPAFVISYIAMTNLKYHSMPYMYLIAIYLPIVVILFYTYVTTKKEVTNKNFVSNSGTLNYEALDNAITGSVGNILKLGAFITIFSILGAFIGSIPFDNVVAKSLLLGFAEITTGISYTCAQSIPEELKILITLLINAFGGLSCLFQSNIFIKESGLSIKKYMYSKFILAILTFLAWHLLVHVLNFSIK